MEKARLGKTGLIVTRMGWGGIPIQRVSVEEAVPVIRSVVEMGVDLLDTARAYSDSEHKIGLALEGLDRRVVLSTKSQVKTAAIYDEVRESLRQLKVPKIDIYHLHMVPTIEEYEKAMAPGSGFDALLRARDEGLIDHIGLTSHNLDVLLRAAEEARVSVIMACYSFLEPQAAEKVFPAALSRDIGVLAMKPFSGGVIEEAGPALRYVFSTKGIVPIPGTETIEKTRENWRIFTEGGSLTEQDKERIEAIRKERNYQFCRRCDYCQPCTEGISIQLILGMKSTLKRFGVKVLEIGWLREGIEKARNCSDCGECLKRCPYGLAIPDLIKENLSLYDSFRKG